MDQGMRGYLLGIVTVIVVFIVGGFAVYWFALMPMGADAPKFPLEQKMANHMVNATIDREAPSAPYPFGPPTGATILAGAKLYMTNCSVCHGSAGSDQSAMSKGQYVPVPQFTKHGVDDDPEGETYWKIEHGYRFTGMPSFKGNLSEEQIWQITYFLKRGMANLPADADAIWHQTHGD
jgi:mono/diheme cytochrome c family protein